MNEIRLRPEGQPITERAPDMSEMIYRLATDDKVSVEKLEALLSLKERIDASARALQKEDEADAARRAYDEAMAAAQAEIPVVLKNKANQQTRSNYADLAALARDALPVITKHGFSLSFSPAPAPDGYFGIRYRCSHRAGHAVEDTFAMPSAAMGAKGGQVMTHTHAFGSAMTYGRRYVTCMLFNIATGDDDGNAADESDPLITAEQFRELSELMEKAAPKEEKFLDYLGVERLEHLTNKGFLKAAVALKAKIKREEQSNA